MRNRLHPCIAALGAIALIATAAAAAPRPPIASLVAPGTLSALDAQTRSGAALRPTDPYCDTPDAVAANIVDSYGERQVRSEALGDGALDSWFSPELETWTVVYRRADGIACVASYGGGDLPYAERAPLQLAFEGGR